MSAPQAPLAQYARQLLQKAAARLAMRSSGTQEVQLGGSGGKRKRGRDEDSDDEAGGSGDEGEQAAVMEGLGGGGSKHIGWLQAKPTHGLG
jgi:hypothetical protein